MVKCIIFLDVYCYNLIPHLYVLIVRSWFVSIGMNVQLHLHVRLNLSLLGRFVVCLNVLWEKFNGLMQARGMVFWKDRMGTRMFLFILVQYKETDSRAWKKVNLLNSQLLTRIKDCKLKRSIKWVSLNQIRKSWTLFSVFPETGFFSFPTC